MTGVSKAAEAFVSYSWDDDQHKAWNRQLAERLRSDGVSATLDQWGTVPGDQLPAFMERAVAGNDFIIIVCTPRYKERSERRIGGVGYEGDIMTAELLQKGNHRKFIPVLRRGEWKESAPGWLAGKYFVDLRDGPNYEAQYQDLLSTVLGTRPAPPPVATKAAAHSSAPAPQPPPDADAPIRILGVVVDEVTEPRNDGTRGSALYAVPFRLSRSASSDWGAVFVQVWDHPPRLSTMHRPRIARVRGSRIILDGTTIDEVQKYHRETLVLCVNETNRILGELQAKVRKQEAEKAQRSAEHQKQVRDAAAKIRFDE